MELNYTIEGNPITKKNSQRMVYAKGRVIPLPSKQYVDYEKKAAQYLTPIPFEPIKHCEITCKYFMQTRRAVDLTNLLEATDDILVKHRIIEDDNYKVLFSHDGSRVDYDKENPRVEIKIKVVEESAE